MTASLSLFTRAPGPQRLFWFGLSIGFAIFYASLDLKQAFAHEYVVQGDTRAYLVALSGLLGGNLVPHDWIADYYASVSPWGFTQLYLLMAHLGVAPLLFSKILPLFLEVAATIYGFFLVQEMFPVPLAGFIGTLLLNQGLGIHDDIVSATPRGFIYPLLLGFMYYLARSSWPGVALFSLLLGLFFPIGVLLSSALLALRLVMAWLGWRPRELPVYIAGLTVSLAVVLSYLLSESQFGPTVTAAMARHWPEYQPHGRCPFFNPNPWIYWFRGSGSSFRLAINPPATALAFLLPWLPRFRTRLPLGQKLGPAVWLLPELALVSLAWFFAAQALLFQLYLPSRYTEHSFRIILALAGGIALVILADGVLNWVSQSPALGKTLAGWGALLGVGLTTVFYPALFWSPFFPITLDVVSPYPALYEFFRNQPSHTLVASLADEANNVPVFAQRSILVGWKYADPYHLRYYQEIRERATDLIKAQYSPTMAELELFQLKYPITHWLLDESAFDRGYLEANQWIQQYQPAAAKAEALINRGLKPAIAERVEHCTVLHTQGLIVLDAPCLTNSPARHSHHPATNLLTE